MAWAQKALEPLIEEVYNIPCILSGPGIPRGREETKAIVGIADIAPTLLDLCCVAPIPGAHGKSFRPLLEDPNKTGEWNEGYAEFFGQRFMYTQRILWRENWKYVFNPCGIDELYNLAGDPNERVNLADNPACGDKLREMSGHLWRKIRDVGDKTMFNSHYPTMRTAPVGPGVAGVR